MTTAPRGKKVGLTRKWWVLLLLLFLLFIPAYTSSPLNPADTPRLIVEVLSRPLIYSAPVVFPIFKLIPVLLVLAIFFFGKRSTRWFTGYAAFTLLLCATLQNMAFTSSYGFAILTGNLVVYLILAGLWIWETIAPKNELRPIRLPVWRYWVVPPALLALWFPVNTHSAVPSPDFSLANMVANEAGLTFCMLLPVYLAILTLFSEQANPALLRVTGFVGTVTGLLNVTEFFLTPSYGWWMGILHLPLLLISSYVLIMACRHPKARSGYSLQNHHMTE